MLILATPNSAFMQINILLLIGTVMGIVLFYRGFGLLGRKRLIQDVPTSTIHAAALGLVEVNGTVTGGSALLSPLSQLDCYFYQLTAWRMSGSGDYRRWKKVAEESLSVPFFLDDETGRVLVDPKGAELEIPPDYSEEYGSDSSRRSSWGPAADLNPEISVSDAVGHFLARHDISRDQPIKVEERCVKKDDRLFVLGTLCENTSAKVETKTAARSAYISASAAELQRDVALGSLLPDVEKDSPTVPPGRSNFFDNTTADAAGATPKTPVVLMKGPNNPTFFISSFSQQEVLGELRWKAPLYIFGGPLLTVVCLWNLFVRFGVL